MKRLISIFVTIISPLLLISQVNEYSAKRIRATDSMYVNGRWVSKITTNLNSADSNSHNMVPTNRAVMDILQGGGGGVSPTSNFRSDIPTLSEIKIYSPAQGVASSNAITNYSHTSVDSTRYQFSRTRAGISGTEYGGWLVPTASGDSIKVTAPFWVVFGDSQAEGHPGKHGRLHWLLSGSPQNSFKYDYPDSAGQLSYHLRTRTNMRFYNHGIGGQTTTQCRIRFYRDVLGQNVPAIPDGRGARTISRKPDGVIIIVGINDVFNGVGIQTIKENIEWFAASCQENGIRCVILNLPGDALSGQAELIKIATINEWLKSGVLDQYGACLVDYNTWWNNPAYGNDNIHPTALIVDDIHPSAVGYDSLAAYIVRQAKLPVLTKAVFINELSSSTPVGYARPSAITIDGTAYALASLNDTIAINTFVPDSLWIKITGSVPVTVPDTTGFSHIEWMQDNNPTDSTFYTRKTLYSGSQKTTINASGLTLISPSGATTTMIEVKLPDMTNHGLQLNVGSSGAQMVLNGLSNTAILNSSALSIYQAGGNAVGTNGSIVSSAFGSQFGSLQVGNNTAPGTTGFGIGVYGGAINLEMGGSGTLDNDGLVIKKWSTLTPNVSFPNKLQGTIRTSTGWGNTGDNDSLAALVLTPTFNDTTVSTGIPGFFGGTFYRANPISLGNNRHFANWTVNGDNWWNTGGGSTVIGSNRVTPRKLFVDGSVGLRRDSLPTITDATDQYLVSVDASATADSNRLKKFLMTNLLPVGQANQTLTGNRSILGAEVFDFSFVSIRNLIITAFTTSVAGRFTIENEMEESIVEHNSSFSFTTSVNYVWTGTTGTGTLPDLATSTKRIYHVKNAGGGNLTIDTMGGNLYDTGSTSTITVLPGETRTLKAGTSYWYVFNN